MTEKITAMFIIEIAGKPVENVEKALNLVLNKLKNDSLFKFLDGEIDSPEYDENSTLYQGFMEVRIKFNTTKDILDFILDYTPSSIEIEDPETFQLDLSSFNGLLNDFSQIILKSQNEVRQLRALVHHLKNSKK